MVQINRLRLSGFKSFVDKTELDIGGGLNGIVGPNGCGKSNLVEALRWVMGENRAKNMRSGDMEDVIFAGTAARPARNIAEVTVLLDNTDGKAPAPFGSHAQIEVTRRIERDKGSQYLVNGKQVRARDVQLLFADALTGSHSPALVSQGRVTQLIGAKPEERRKMLEESAGVASLYARRHEAELRLKAADENLARLDLVLNELMNRANNLRGQSKQAVRYRELSENIRRYESLLVWQEWGATRDRLRKEDVRFTETDMSVRDALTKSSDLTVRAQEASETVEEQRKIDTEARATLQLIRQTSEQLEREMERRKNEFNDLLRQMEQASSDLNLAVEQRDALRDRAAVIKADLEKIAAEDAGTPAELTQLEADYATAQATARDGENDVLGLQDRIRSVLSERDIARNALQAATQQEEKLSRQLQQIEAEFALANEKQADEEELAGLQATLEDLRSKRDTAQESAATTQSALDAIREELNTARDTLAALQQETSLKEREIKSLNDLLARLSKGFENSLLLSLDIPADLAKAVSAAAGDAALRATSDDWATSGDAFRDNDWAAGIQPLNTLINVPANLAAFASAVGVVDGAQGAALANSLQRGQILVSRDGHVWRWDGLSIPPQQGEDAEAKIVSIKSQIREAEALSKDFAPALADAQQVLEEITLKRDAAANELAFAQGAAKENTNAFYSTEKRIEQLNKIVNDRAVRRTLLAEQSKAAAANAEAAVVARKEAEAKAGETESGNLEFGLRSELAAAEQLLSKRRGERDEISVKIEALKAAAAQVRHLRESLEGEQERTIQQIARSENHSEQLRTRMEELEARKETLAPQVEKDDQGLARQDMLDRITAAEDTVRDTSDAFTQADNLFKSLQSDLKKVEEEGSSLREKRAVIQATVAALQTEQTRIATEIEDRFSTSPAALENMVMVDWPEGLPSQSKAKSEREHLNREREAMGAVNLRAEIELTETEDEHAKLEAEKNDLAAAIARLREGIGNLNGEARERIVNTFNAVNVHFQDLFKRLFGGGDAHLKLEGDEDPLNCGLEIYAQTPGKSLQNLNQLSGGAQTLTAVATIFAMFLSNPAPVCVLDEVDAPLDDANVDRVCGLLEEMAATCATRFLVITHHRMTMARMDRLYGVTMAERGVSQLVSVNLAAQGELLDQHKAA